MATGNPQILVDGVDLVDVVLLFTTLRRWRRFRPQCYHSIRNPSRIARMLIFPGRHLLPFYESTLMPLPVTLRPRCRASRVPNRSPVFQVQCQIRPAKFNNSSTQHHMDVIGLDVVQQALIVCDDQHTHVLAHQGIDAVCNDAQRVDIQTGIGLIQDGDLRLERCHLQDLGALFLAT